jgi:hypothetical protein
MENEELLDYEDEEQHEQQNGNKVDNVAKKDVKGTYVSIHSSGFKDFLLKPELLRAIMDCGFEHPSEGIKINEFQKKKITKQFKFILLNKLQSSTRVYPASDLVHGRHMSSQVGYG